MAKQKQIPPQLLTGVGAEVIEIFKGGGKNQQKVHGNRG